MVFQGAEVGIALSPMSDLSSEDNRGVVFLMRATSPP
jgi:hypothetical protein